MNVLARMLYSVSRAGMPQPCLARLIWESWYRYAVLIIIALAVADRGRSAKTLAPPPKPLQTPWCHICSSRPKQPAVMGVAPDVPLKTVVPVSLVFHVVVIVS